MSSWETQLRKGLVELVVLASVARGETYGYGIVEHLRDLPGLEFTESTIYPVLTRLASDGFLSVRSEPSRSGPPRRYYQLTDEGRLRLDRMAQQWNEVSGSLARLLEEGKP
jgi:PadR family transcriptional regulator PadR